MVTCTVHKLHVNVSLLSFKDFNEPFMIQLQLKGRYNTDKIQTASILLESIYIYIAHLKAIQTANDSTFLSNSWED